MKRAAIPGFLIALGLLAQFDGMFVGMVLPTRMASAEEAASHGILEIAETSTEDRLPAPSLAPEISLNITLLAVSQERLEAANIEFPFETPLVAAGQKNQGSTQAPATRLSALRSAVVVGEAAEQFVKVLEEGRIARVISRPKIVARSGEQASLSAIAKVPSGSNADPIAATRDVGVTMEFISTVLADGRCRIDSRVECARAILNENAPPVVHRISSQTCRELMPGQAMVFSGPSVDERLLSARADDDAAPDDGESWPRSVLLAVVTPTIGTLNPWSPTLEDTKPVADDQAHIAPAPSRTAEEQSSQLLLHFKIFNVSKKRAAEAGIDLATILGRKHRDTSVLANREAADPGAEAVMSTISRRERELLAKLLTVSGAAKLLADPTLVTEFGRKTKFHSGAEVLSPGPPKDGIVTTEFRDIGLKIEARPNDAQTLLTDLRVEYSEIDPSRPVPANGFAFPPVRTRWVHLSVPLSMDETAVLGGPAYDSLLVMVTPEPVASEQRPDQAGRHVGRDERESPDLVRLAEQLKQSTEAMQRAMRELTAIVEERLAGKEEAFGSAEPSPLPSPQAAPRGPQAIGIASRELKLPYVQQAAQALAVSAELIEPQSGFIAVGDKVTLHVTVTNNGEQVLSNVRARMIAENGTAQLPRHSQDIFRALRKLSPGESKLLGFDFVPQGEGYVRNAFEVEADGGYISRLLHVVLVAKPGANRKAINDPRTAWPDLAGGDTSQLKQSQISGVVSGWEQTSTGGSVYTIRVGSALTKPLRDGSAIQVAMEGDRRKLREFRVVMGPVSRQESFTESDTTFEVDHGWRPNDKGGMDYYVQVSREQLEELAKGGTLNCEIHPDVKVIDKVYVFVGDAKLPRIAAP